jgi:hypothetical protein
VADDSAERIELTLHVAAGMHDVDKEDWDGLANPEGASFDPFMSWNFLEALESAGCATPQTGWDPRHILLRDLSGRLVGAAPFYLKSHSRGEFVFDHAWADALHRAGGRYYPKFLCAVPFTPVSGRRLLAEPGPFATSVRRMLAHAMVDLAADAHVSSVHVNFVDADAHAAATDEGLMPRLDQQFHWFNRGYDSFEAFLGALSSRKRKMIRKERTIAQEGLRIERLTGRDLKPSHWDAFFRFYMDTGGRKWGSPYLNRKFFATIHERMADACLLVLAYDGARPVAGALNLIGSDAIYGRYWGRSVERSCLHFEICYYQAIEFAIEKGLSRVEAGAQGEHKLARGYEPAITRSMHWIAHPGLRAAVDRYLDSEREAVKDGVAQLAAFTPFRRDEGDAVGAAAEHEHEEGF